MCMLTMCLCVATMFVAHCDAGKTMQLFEDSTTSLIRHVKKERVARHLEVDFPYESSNTNPFGVSSPILLPPFDSLAPTSLPETNSPFCVYPPPPPPTSIPTPIIYTPSPPMSPSSSSPSSPPPPFYYIPPIIPIENPPPSPYSFVPSPPDYSDTPNPPEMGSSPPEYDLSPPIYVPNPPTYEPSPPSSNPSPPSYTPTPGGGSGGGIVPSPVGGGGVFVPSPPVFQPPVVFPPPAVPPPPPRGESLTLWCVAKPTVPDPIIEEAMNYACGFGADCEPIQPSGSCYEPNTFVAHASYAFNSYWQSTKVAGGTCDFGGTAIFVAVDPSFDGCHFVYN